MYVLWASKPPYLLHSNLYRIIFKELLPHHFGSHIQDYLMAVSYTHLDVYKRQLFVQHKRSIESLAVLALEPLD